MPRYCINSEGISVLAKIENVLALSAKALRERAASFPDSLAVASDQERISKLEFSEMVNAFARVLSEIPRSSSFLPVLVGTNINSVILYHAAILSRTPVALIDANINPIHLEKILTKLQNPEILVVTAPEFSPSLANGVVKITVGRERQDDFEFPEVDVDESAIVIFSSGSTGEPKGSIWTWKNLDDSFNVMTSYYPDGGTYYLGRVTSIAYAAGAYQMLSAALDHNLHLINPTLSPDEIIEFVNRNNLRQLAFSSSFAERIFDQRSLGNSFENVEEILTYGEAVSWEQIRKLREITRGKAVVRASYGASESPGFAIYLPIRPDAPLSVGRVPIGYLHDVENVDFIPNSEDPEIMSLIIRNFVAQGYLDDPVLTDQKFTVNARGERCYHTGDLVRIGESGVISFVGRGDDLVKINGRLVGPAESEALLRVLPGVVNVVVLPHATSQGKSYLAAHLVLSPTSQLTPTDLYEYLLGNLSSHLIPAQLVRHQELPLNSNGKVDRKALQTKQWPWWKENEKSYVPTIFENFTLSQLRRILNTPDLSLTEDIFGSGMDSLAALEFQAIASEFGYENISPGIFLEHRTVQSIALYLAEGKPFQQSNFVTLNKKGAKAPYILFPGAGVSAIFFKELADELGSDQPVIVIEPEGMHTSAPVAQTLEEMANSAANEINHRQPAGVIFLVGHSAGSAIACEAGVVLSAMGREIKMISLDATGVANRVAMSPRFFEVHFFYHRIRNILTRSPQRMLKTIQRRRRALNKSSYDFFTIHIGRLTIHYKLKAKPTFPILFLYCAGKKNEKFWLDAELYSFQEIAGEHFTMLNREYLPHLTAKISAFFTQ